MEFEPGQTPGLAFVGMGEELSKIIGRRVDFKTRGWLSPYFRDEVVREAETVYDAV